MRQLKTKSHMLRHMVEMHEGEKREDVQFGVRILRQAKTAFERQIMESVLIQEMRGHHLMNLKSEYNRCAIPRLVTKLGEKDLDKWRDEDRDEQKREENLERKIRMLRKERNKERQVGVERAAPAPNPKRRKVNETHYVQTGREKLGQPENRPQEKRQRHVGEDAITTGKRQKMQAGDIRLFFTTHQPGKAVVRQKVPVVEEKSEDDLSEIRMSLAESEDLLHPAQTDPPEDCEMCKEEKVH